MKRVLITGSQGFTGQYLVQRLVRDGHEVFGLDRPSPRRAATAPGVQRIFAADLLDADALARAVAEVQPHRVVHLAAVSSVAHGDVRGLYDANIVGTRFLFEALSRAAPGLEAVLFASSANVYGNQASGALGEDRPALPANDYGVSKLAGEHLARIHGDRLPMIVVRPFNYTGVGQPTNFLVPKIVDHARRGATKLELGNVAVERDFSDVRGVVDAYARLLDRAEAVGGVFNVCSGRPRSLADVVAMVEQAAGLRFDLSVNPAFVRSDEVRSLHGDKTRIEALIGPLDMPPFEDTISWMVNA